MESTTLPKPTVWCPSPDGVEYSSEEVTVVLPDLFQTFLKKEPVVNPNYDFVGLESRQWMTKFCDLGPILQKKIQRLDFAYFCGICAPHAPPEKYRTLCDWGNWVFLYDDMFDSGELRDSPEEAKEVANSLLEPFFENEGTTQPRLRIVEAHDDLAFRMRSKCSNGAWARFLKAMHKYNSGVVNHVDDQLPSLEKMIEIRRESAGARPLYHLTEYAHDIQLPDEVFQNDTIQELERLGMDMVFITNDMLSYKKEEVEGTTFNITSVYRLNGMSAQEAFDAAGNLLNERYRRWDEAEANLPSWGAEVDGEVARYIEGIKGVVQADLEWSFKTHRYFGKDSQRVREERTFTVMKYPPYLTTGVAQHSKSHYTVWQALDFLKDSVMSWVVRLFFGSEKLKI